jgi:hypothetical protein
VPDLIGARISPANSNLDQSNNVLAKPWFWGSLKWIRNFIETDLLQIFMGGIQNLKRSVGNAYMKILTTFNYAVKTRFIQPAMLQVTRWSMAGAFAMVLLSAFVPGFAFWIMGFKAAWLFAIITYIFAIAGETWYRHRYGDPQFIKAHGYSDPAALDWFIENNPIIRTPSGFILNMLFQVIYEPYAFVMKVVLRARRVIYAHSQMPKKGDRFGKWVLGDPLEIKKHSIIFKTNEDKIVIKAINLLVSPKEWQEANWFSKWGLGKCTWIVNATDRAALEFAIETEADIYIRGTKGPLLQKHAAAMFGFERLIERNCVYFALEDVGETLSEWMKKQKFIWPQEAQERLNNLLDAVAAYCAQGILLVDIKPEHVSKDGRKIIDFGNAFRIQDLEYWLGYLTFTRGYASLEGNVQQLFYQEKPLDERSVIHPIGATIFEMATGNLFVKKDNKEFSLDEFWTKELPDGKLLGKEGKEGAINTLKKFLPDVWKPFAEVITLATLPFFLAYRYYKI